MSTLADRLKQALERRPGTSQADLARLTGAKSPSVSNWFGGRTKTLSVEHAHKLGAFFGCDPQWLSIGAGAPQWSDAPPVDVLHAPATPTPPDLAAALPVVLGRLPGLDTYRAGQVLHAVQSATQPGADLERIERDLLQWLTEPRQAVPQAQPGKRAGTR